MRQSGADEETVSLLLHFVAAVIVGANFGAFIHLLSF